MSDNERDFYPPEYDVTEWRCSLCKRVGQATTRIESDPENTGRPRGDTFLIVQCKCGHEEVA